MKNVLTIAMTALAISISSQTLADRDRGYDQGGRYNQKGGYDQGNRNYKKGGYGDGHRYYNKGAPHGYYKGPKYYKGYWKNPRAYNRYYYGGHHGYRGPYQVNNYYKDDDDDDIFYFLGGMYLLNEVLHHDHE